MASDGFTSKKVKIYVNETNDDLSVTAGVVTQTALDTFTGDAETKNFTSALSKSDNDGGDSKLSKDDLLGGGAITFNESRDMLKNSWDVVVLKSKKEYFDKLQYGESLNSAGDAKIVSILLIAEDDADVYGRFYKNVSSVKFKLGVEAGKYLKGSMDLETAPTDPDGNPNMSVITSITS